MEQALLGYFYSGVVGVPFVVAFFAGILSFLSPCTLPLVPFYMSYISGISLSQIASLDSTQSKPATQTNKFELLYKTRLMIFACSFAFVLGFSFVFIVMGLLLQNVFFLIDSRALEIVAGCIVIAFGVHFLGIVRFKSFYFTKKFNFTLNHPALKIFAPFVLGISFGLGWSPCTGPIFGAIALMASTSSTQGIALLGVYTLGFALPFLLLAYALERGFEIIDRLKPHLRKVEILSGVMLICIGGVIIGGYLDKINQWFF